MRKIIGVRVRVICWIACSAGIRTRVKGSEGRREEGGGGGDPGGIHTTRTKGSLKH